MKKSKFIAHLLVMAMAVTSFSGVAQNSEVNAAAAKPKLSASSKTIKVGGSFKLSVKKNGVKSITKVTWKSSKKKVAALSTNKKTSRKVTGKKNGTSKITATVSYKLKSGKAAKKKFTCTVKVSNAPDVVATTVPTAVVTTAPTTAPVTPVVTPTVEPTATPIPTEVPYYNTKGYFAGYDGNKSYRGKDNLYVNYIMVDSKEVNKVANIVDSISFKIDSNATVEYGVYVSDDSVNASSIGESAKVGSFTTNGTVGQEVTVPLSGAALDNLSTEKISFGFYSTTSDKTLQTYCIYNMFVGYNDTLYPATLTDTTVGCTGSTKGIYTTRAKDSSSIISNEYTSLAELTQEKGYKFGTCVTYDQIVGDEEFKKLIAKHCDSITATNEFKAYSLLSQSASQNSEDGMPGLDFTKADAIAKFAQDNGLKVRGHALVWDQSMTQWFFNEGYAANEVGEDGTTVTNRVSSEVMKERLRSYIDQVITHFETEFPGVVYCWDVVNEAIDENDSTDALKIRQSRSGEDNPFYYVLGADYVQYSFLCARDTLDKLGNTSIDLVYNDYNVIYGNKRTPILKLVDAINAYDKNEDGSKRILCDTIGMQGYLGYGQQNNCLKDDLVTSVTSAINEIAKKGLKVQLTEMAMRNFTNTDKYMNDHATFSSKLFSALADINTTTNGAFTSMSIWAFIDNPVLNYTDDTYDYDIYTPYSGLFDDVFTAKDSFYEVYKAMGGQLPE